MIIGLHSGKVFKCDDMSYHEVDHYTGETTHIFVNLEDKKKYTALDSAIEFWEETLTGEELDELMTWGDEEIPEEEDVSFG